MQCSDTKQGTRLTGRLTSLVHSIEQLKEYEQTMHLFNFNGQRNIPFMSVLVLYLFNTLDVDLLTPLTEKHEKPLRLQGVTDMYTYT